MGERRATFDKLIGPIGVSALCVAFLAAGWAYSGSVLPSTKGASGTEAIVIWAIWTIVLAVPLVTISWWAMERRKGRPRG